MDIPRLWHVVKWLPRSWRLALLRALAWPEFEVDRLVAVAGPGTTTGLRVERVPLVTNPASTASDTSPQPAPTASSAR